jgi:Thrombospondin type 3 repeat
MSTRTIRQDLLKPTLGVALLLAMVLMGSALGLFVFGEFGSSAVQAPEIMLDMDPGGNTYDSSTNTMTVGVVNPCLGTTPGNNAQHTHTAHLLIKNVEDLAGWQLRLNYDGGKMRPQNVNGTPFTDNTTSQSVSFLNLPINSGSGTHQDVSSIVDIPAPFGGPQTALIGGIFGGRTIPLSPDTPAKSQPDDTSYSAPSGGVLAEIQLLVPAGNAGQLLSIDLDDANPNRPGSKVLVFTGTGQQTINLPETSLGDGAHGEGVACPGATPTPTATASPTPTNPLDGDGDGVPNAVDNCPSWPNPSQNLPPWPVPANDPDCDGFSNAVENSAGTNPNVHCGSVAWPPDINNDTFVDVIGDISQVSGQFANSVPPAPARYDIAPDPPDHFIDVIGDISKMSGFFSLGCS